MTNTQIRNADETLRRAVAVLRTVQTLIALQLDHNGIADGGIPGPACDDLHDALGAADELIEGVCDLLVPSPETSP